MESVSLYKVFPLPSSQLWRIWGLLEFSKRKCKGITAAAPESHHDCLAAWETRVPSQRRLGPQRALSNLCCLNYLQNKFHPFVNLHFWRKVSSVWGYVYIKEMRFLIILLIFFSLCHLIIRASVFLGSSESVLCWHANASWCWFFPQNTVFMFPACWLFCDSPHKWTWQNRELLFLYVGLGLSNFNFCFAMSDPHVSNLRCIRGIVFPTCAFNCNLFLLLFSSQLLKLLNFIMYFCTSFGEGDSVSSKWSEKGISFSTLDQVCLHLCLCLGTFQTLYVYVPRSPGQQAVMHLRWGIILLWIWC